MGTMTQHQLRRVASAKLSAKTTTTLGLATATGPLMDEQRALAVYDGLLLGLFVTGYEVSGGVGTPVEVIDELNKEIQGIDRNCLGTS
jgi:hypothetical protein